ncbi:MAG TPA: lysophospholipid acyltransferase family protein [Prevotella sp.]
MATPKFAHSIMKIVYYLTYGFWYLFSLLPLRVLYVLSDGFYLLVCHVVRYRHGVIWRNLSQSFPDKSAKELRRIEKEFYHWFCDYVVETIKLMTMSADQLKRRMTFSGTELVDGYTAQGRSCAVYLGHYGNWEWITSLPYWVSGNAQCMQIYHPLENKNFDDLFRQVREKNGSLCVPMAETLRRVVTYQQLKKPIIMGYISDQVPFWNNIHHWQNFLNHDTPVLTGSEKIIKATNQVAFYGDVKRLKRGHYHCTLCLLTDDPKQVPDYGLTDMYFERLQQTICRQPELYLWSHNRWKRTHEEFNLRFNPATGRVDLRDIETIKQERQAAPPTPTDGATNHGIR